MGTTSTDAERLALVVVHYEALAELDAMLAGLGEGLDEVVVVDNRSPTPGVREVVARHAGVRLVEAPANLGYGGGANLGVRSTTAGVVVVANPDLVVDGAAIRRLAAELRDGVAVVSGRIVDESGRPERTANRRDPFVGTAFVEWCQPVGALLARVRPGWHPALLRAAEHDQDRDVASLLGALLVLDRSAFDEVGGFDDRYFLYREETDLCRRLRAAGRRVRYCATVTVTHLGDASSRSAVPVVLRAEYVRSCRRFVRTHAGRAAAVALDVVRVVSALLSLVTGPRRDHARALLRGGAR